MWMRIAIVISVAFLAWAAPALAQDIDPSLAAWWALDEDSGTVASDSSGNGNDGTVNGGAQWVAGQIDGALQFNGSNAYVSAPHIPFDERSFTIAMWVNPVLYTGEQVIFSQRQTSATDTDMHFRLGGPGIASGNVPVGGARMGFYSNDLDTPGGLIQDNEWYHLTFWYDFENQNRRIYVNGKLEAEAASTPYLGTSGNTVIGSWAGGSQWFQGIIDDVRVYDRPLLDAEVKELAFLPQARDPQPANGATAVTQPLLQWTAGDSAMWHNLYLGKSPELTQADLVGNRLMWTMYYHVAGLEAATTYYWRVDEIETDGVTMYEGTVWSFSTPPRTASEPSPRNGDKWIDADVTLTWKPGMGATGHDVYFSTDAAAVSGRDAGVLVGNRQPAARYDPDALQAGTTYYWLVDEYDMTGAKHEGEVWSFTVDDGKGGGVKGEYFNNMNVSGAPALTRIDPAIDFNWGDPGGPGAPIGVDGFSARWSGDLEIAIADTYTFITTTDDGVRLWLDSELIVDNWTDHGSTDDFSSPIYLEPGVYPLQMEWYENGGGAVAQLSWETPDVARQIIPAGPLQPPVRARAGYPRNGAVDVPQDVILTWGAGEQAVQHQVYFGDDRDAVVDAAPSTAGIYRGQQGLDETTYTVSGLEWNKTYFWRIDEVNTVEADSPWKGAVWSFTTADFIVVDDFESYTNEVGQRVFQTWIDGLGYTEPAPGMPGNNTGALVGHDIWSPDSPYYQGQIVETAIVHGGSQAMPVYFDNSATPYVSEAGRTWTTAQDWTVNGVTDLGLWFHGSPAGFIDNGGGSFTVSAAGTDIWGTADQFRYVYKSLNGNGTITAKVESIENTNAWAKGGVMIREGLDAAAKLAMVVVTPGQGVQFTWRDFTAADMTEHNTQAQLTAPHWVRLTRAGNTFTAEHSADGVTWEPVVDAASNTHDVAMIGNVYIGLCLTSHNANAVTIAEFSNVTTSGGVSGQWQVEEVGVDHPDNALADVYVRLEDSQGRSDTEVYANGTVVNGWTQWRIPLADFDGVSISRVKKMTLGIGNPNAPVADGSGMVLYDDILVLKPAPAEPNEPNEVAVE